MDSQDDLERKGKTFDVEAYRLRPPIGSPLRNRAPMPNGDFTRQEAEMLASGLVDAIRESLQNIQLWDLVNIANKRIVGIIKSKFGWWFKGPEFVAAIVAQDWEKCKNMLTGLILGFFHIKDIKDLVDDIRTVDNGRAYITLMKNHGFKALIGKQA